MPQIFDGTGSCVLKDVRAPGTGPGNATPNTYITRVLNTLEGDGWFCSLASNMFTLQPGRYNLSAISPQFGYWGPTSKSRLWNVTDAMVFAVGTGQISSNTSGSNGAYWVSICPLEVAFELTVSKTFMLQHRANSSHQLGWVVGSDSEIYAQVRIDKIW